MTGSASWIRCVSGVRQKKLKFFLNLRIPKHLFARAADFLLNEPESYRKHLQNLLRAGKTFPQARAQALQAEDPALAVLLGTPNNVLGVEYCKALQKFSSAIRPLPIRRKGNGYDSTALEGDFCSATALRQALLTASCPESSDSVPDKSLFSGAVTSPASENRNFFISLILTGFHRKKERIRTYSPRYSLTFRPIAILSLRKLLRLPSLRTICSRF